MHPTIYSVPLNYGAYKYSLYNLLYTELFVVELTYDNYKRKTGEIRKYIKC